MWAHDPRWAQDMSTSNNLCSPVCGKDNDNDVVNLKTMKFVIFNVDVDDDSITSPPLQWPEAKPLERQSLRCSRCARLHHHHHHHHIINIIPSSHHQHHQRHIINITTSSTIKLTNEIHPPRSTTAHLRLSIECLPGDNYCWRYFYISRYLCQYFAVIGVRVNVSIIIGVRVKIIVDVFS